MLIHVILITRSLLRRWLLRCTVVAQKSSEGLQAIGVLNVLLLLLLRLQLRWGTGIPANALGVLGLSGCPLTFCVEVVDAGACLRHGVVGRCW